MLEILEAYGVKIYEKDGMEKGELIRFAFHK